ncbi:MAG: flippase-like domain-containing protein, partial [Selenomonadaceae bacterium]
YHIIITFYSIIMFIIKRDYVANELATGRSFIYFGLILNSLGIIAIFAILYNSVIAEKTIVVLIKILQKFNLAKNVKSETISKHILEYKTSLYEISNNKKILIIVSLLTTLQITVYFSVTYFVYLSLGLRKYSYFDILAVQTLLYMAVNFIPTPGNSGASEGGFYLLFALIFPHSVLLYAIVLWRLVVFYFNLLATGSIVLGDQILKRLKPKF